MKHLPTLYKLTNTGALQMWQISSFINANDHGVIQTDFGQVGSDNIQSTTDIVSVGKNIGKKNETTPYEQAEIEAKQKWDKKIKSGYMEDRNRVEAGATDLEGIKPMLAHVYEDYKDKLKFPVVVQPKLDGMRCIAVIQDGQCKLFSRTQKAINTVPHIVKELEHMYKDESITLDGELYVHAGDNFNELMSILKRDELHPDHEKIQYWVYDIPSSQDVFANRNDFLPFTVQTSPIVPVFSHIAEDEQDVDDILNDFITSGYEGVMIRIPDSKYENKRSKSLLKYKKFQDAEFKVIGVEEGKGKLMGKAGAFVCETKEGKQFNVKMEGTLDSLTNYLVNFSEFSGKYLTVRFFSYTIDGVPRFPVGVGFRNEKDLDVS